MRLALVLAIVLLAAPAARAAEPIEVHASVDRDVVGLGDRFTYTVEAHGPKGMTVLAGAGPFAVVAAPSTSRDGSVVRIRQELVCLDRGCAPDDADRRVELPPATATAGAARASARTAVTLRPRVPARAVKETRARYRSVTDVPAADVPWTALTLGLLAGALLCGGVAAALVARAFAPRRDEQRGRFTGGLAYALRVLRESAARPVPDRRRAADYVARAAAASGGVAVADDATRIAWSAPEPGPPDVTELADRVESTLGGTT